MLLRIILSDFSLNIILFLNLVRNTCTGWHQLPEFVEHTKFSIIWTIKTDEVSGYGLNLLPPSSAQTFTQGHWHTRMCLCKGLRSTSGCRPVGGYRIRGYHSCRRKMRCWCHRPLHRPRAGEDSGTRPWFFTAMIEYPACPRCLVIKPVYLK